MPVLNDGARIQKQILEQNNIIRRWRPKVKRALKRSAMRFADGKSGMVVRRNHTETKLASTINTKAKKTDGVVDYINFNFERHGVFVHKGVGRGYQMRAGKVVRVAKNNSGKTRTAAEWFNPVLDKYLPELADSLAELNANIAINFDKTRIK